MAQTIFSYDTDLDTEVLEETEVLETRGYSLVVWNDEVNTFDWVIETLIDVCGHDSIQAEQCTLIIHFNGKCSVKEGSYEDLKPMCDEITNRKIGATIEVTA